MNVEPKGRIAGFGRVSAERWDFVGTRGCGCRRGSREMNHFSGAIGAGSENRPTEGREYLLASLGASSFNALNCTNLFDNEDGDGHTLVRSDARRQTKDYTQPAAVHLLEFWARPSLFQRMIVAGSVRPERRPTNICGRDGRQSGRVEDALETSGGWSGFDLIFSWRLIHESIDE
jgi:hypothetical protein